MNKYKKSEVQEEEMNCNEILVKETNEEKKKSFHIRQCQ
jgi:hypothetical protein